MKKQYGKPAKKAAKWLLSACMVLLLTGSLWAQGGPTDGDPGGRGLEENPDNVPIDGGLSLLLAAGAAYGGKKVYDMRKQQQKQENKD